MENKSKLSEVVRCLAEAKQGILDAVIKAPASPSVQHTAQVAVDHLDTTYLWCSQLDYFLANLGQDAVEKAVEEAVASDSVIVGDFSKSGEPAHGKA